MEKKRDNKTIFLVVMSIATLIVAGIGATFAYFTATITDDATNVTVESYSFATTLSVEKVYPESGATYNNLIPIDSNLVEAAAGDDHKCVDENGYLVCHLYKLSFSNSGDAVDLTGVINPTTNEFSNLKFKVLDSSVNAISNNIQLTSSAVNMEFDTQASPSTSIHINAGDTSTPTEATYYVLVWLDDTNTDQLEQGKLFDGVIEFTSTAGSKLTGKITI